MSSVNTDHKRTLQIEAVTEIRTNCFVTGIIAGSAFGFIVGIFSGLSTTPFSAGFNSGITSGIFFGIAMALVQKYQYAKHRLLPDDLAAEGVIAHGPAGMQGRAGWLFLTKKGLTFRPNGANRTKSIVMISLNDISDWGEGNSLGIIPNAIKIQKVNGVNERFVVAKRNEWLECFAKLATKESISHLSIKADPAVGSLADEIGKLERLKANGILTAEEFRQAKSKLLAE